MYLLIVFPIETYSLLVHLEITKTLPAEQHHKISLLQNMIVKITNKKHYRNTKTTTTVVAKLYSKARASTLTGNKFTVK